MVAAGGVAEQAPERVLPVQFVVAVGEDQDGGQVGDPPDEETQGVERRIVGPVNVFDDENRRMFGPAQLRVQGGQHPVAVAAVPYGLAELGSHAARQIAERTEGPWGGQVIAVADQHPAGRGQAGPQRLDQAGLADPGLAHDQDDAAGSLGRGLHGISEDGELSVALQNLAPGACGRR